jgi:hypothetical protein
MFASIKSISSSLKILGCQYSRGCVGSTKWNALLRFHGTYAKEPKRYVMRKFNMTHRVCAWNEANFLYTSMSVHYNIQNTNHQQMHKESFIINLTLLHVSTLLGHLQGELFVVVTLRLHFIVEWECAVDCVLEAWSLRGPGLNCSAGRDRRVHASKNNAVHSQQHILTQL